MWELQFVSVQHYGLPEDVLVLTPHTTTMPLKSRSNGIQRITPRAPVIEIIKYSTKERSAFVRSANAAFDRRIGTEESINTRSGIDGRFRNCSHSSRKYLIASAGDVSTPVGNNVPLGSITRIYDLAANVHAKRYVDFTSAISSVAYSVPALDWAGLSSQAIDKMIPQITADTSLVNFILELKDFRNVASAIYQGTLLKSISTAISLVGKSGQTIRQLSRHHLAYQFGWAPLYRDIVSFVELMADFEARFNEIVARANKPQQRYWGAFVSGTQQGETIVVSNPSGDGPNGGWVGDFLGKCRARTVTSATEGIRYHATMRYKYQIPPELRSVQGRLKALLDALGVNGNPAILWNAIPFSFIVDWFVDVSGFLTRLRIGSNLEFLTEISDFCHSARIQRQVMLQIASLSQNLSVQSWSGYTTTDTCTITVYERKVGIPNWRTALQTRGLDPRKWLLGASLVGANYVPGSDRPKPFNSTKSRFADWLTPGRLRGRRRK